MRYLIIVCMFMSASLNAQRIEDMRIKNKSVPLLKSKMFPEEFVKEIESWMGTPYAAGGNRKKSGADDIGFVTAFYKNNFDLSLPASRDEIWTKNIGKRIEFNEEDLDLGDILFLSSNSEGRIDHIAVYLDYEYGLIHATSNGIVETRADEFTGYCIGAKRFVEFTQHFLLRGSADIVTTTVSVNALQKEVDSWVGTPYVWGAAQKKSGSDCSGFVTTVFQNLFGVTLPRCSF